MAEHPGYGRARAYGQTQHRQLNASLRASDADREQTVDVLKAAFTEGRLTQDEYNTRMARAYAARTYGDLGTLTADLPTWISPGAPGYRDGSSSRTNPLAVASLVCGLAIFFGLPAIPAVVFGHMARRQIRRTGEQGSGMALAGLVLGWTAIGLVVLVVLLAAIGAAVAAHGGVSAHPVPPAHVVLPNVHLVPVVHQLRESGS